MTSHADRTDHYAVLGVAPDATREELRAAYRRAARRTHPDLGGDQDEFAAAELAWHVLGDAERRAAHDAELAGVARDPWDGLAWGHDVPLGEDPVAAADADAADFSDPDGAGPYGPYDPDAPPPRGPAARHPRTLPPRHVLVSRRPLPPLTPRARAWGAGGAALVVAAGVVDAQVGSGAVLGAAATFGYLYVLPAALWASGAGGRVSGVLLWVGAVLCATAGLLVLAEADSTADMLFGTVAWIALVTVLGVASVRLFRRGRMRRGAFGWSVEEVTAALVLAEAWNGCLARSGQPGVRLVRVRRARHGVPRGAWAVVDVDGRLLVWAPSAAPDAWHAVFDEAWRRRRTG
ncbi:J domain-containing protein [Cellulomonas wangsupingiae]|uniref:J domain-containing protein n=1 Tax=Cellulomonas wangsupingiae TaxID=2968085 RepID=A0ABY5K3E5_9CELL|nr:J domain-containing protein [Cellulomonas wangsupingiae]MCC2336182.1 J domain-containing protein [Cellulomonas wangsupingiae]UUI64573.1 J domain-containing protein [Cellulomonas wangsupingiae]